MILLNKYMLAYGFPYPITLTMGHMLFCALLAAGLVRAGVVASANISQGTYLRTIMPIGVCQAATLWIGNAAYLYLSVSFIQMLKALSPVAVFLVGGWVGATVVVWCGSGAVGKILGPPQSCFGVGAVLGTLLRAREHRSWRPQALWLCLAGCRH